MGQKLHLFLGSNKFDTLYAVKVGMSLLIVESPAKCGKIRGFLGAGWTVIASMGHIRALLPALESVGLEKDFEPTYEFQKEKAKAIAGIRDAAKGIDPSRIFLAADDDREGEAIAYSVLVLLKLNPATTPRAVFHEITESAVKAAVAAPRRIDMNRVNAQQARAVLDMMVGFTISPLLWKYVASSLSAGRCQTPALRIIADKESDIAGFKTDTVWKVKGNWSTGPLTTALVMTPLAFEAPMVEELEDQESASNFLENIYNDIGGRVTSTTTRPTSEAPPKPLITSSLQQEASAAFGSQPKNTMRIAQRLYEAGHITYMRTDSAVLSEEAKAAAEDWVRGAFGAEYIATAQKAQKKKKEDSTAQEAHEAIRPTHVEAVDLPAAEDWNAADRRIYKLIWQRAVQSVMKPALGEQRTVEFVATGDPNEFGWRATWKRQTFPGWRRIGAKATNLDDPEEVAEAQATDAAWSQSGQITVDTPLKWTKLEAFPQDSRPPARHTEATLIRELEKRGIGRPSTYAALVETIVEKQYVEKKTVPPSTIQVPRLAVAPNVWPPTTTLESKKVGAESNKLSPTPLGRSVLQFCLKEFQTLFDYSFTSQMETRLDQIAEGKEQWKQVCRDTWSSYKVRYEALKEQPSTVTPAAAKQRMFSGGIKGVLGKKGPILLREDPSDKEKTVFYGWPDGVAFADLTDAAAIAFVQTKVGGQNIGTFQGQPMEKKSGPHGVYVACNGVNVPFAEEDTEATLQEKFQKKTESLLHTLGDFEFRNGPYGVFMFKKTMTGKFRKFVNVPQGLDPKVLTLEAATKIFKTGLESKAKAAAYKKSQPPK